MEKLILHPESVHDLELLQKTMLAGNYSKRSITAYLREILSRPKKSLQINIKILILIYTFF